MKMECLMQEETDHPSSSCPYIICKECGEKGHSRKSCPKNQVCLKCGKTGHTIKDCSLTVTLILKKCIEELSSGKCTNLNAETIHEWMGKVGFDVCCGKLLDWYKIENLGVTTLKSVIRQVIAQACVEFT